MNAQHKKPHFLIAPLVLATALAACGGGSSGGTNANGPDLKEGRVSVLISDDLTQNYAEVWVTLKKVVTQDSTRASVVLFDDPNGKVVNLSTLPNIGTLLSTASLPAGRYDDVVVTLDNAIHLVDKTGAATDGTFSASGATVDLRVDGEIRVDAGGTSTVALDFDLKQFTVDNVTGIVTPVIIYNDDTNNLKGTYAELEGRVQAGGSATQFTLLPEHGATPITVTLTSGALVYRDRDRQTLTDLSTLRANDEVEIRGSYDPATFNVVASRVALHAEDSSHSGSNGLSEVEGIVQSFDGGTLVIDVKKAEFVPTTSTLTIANVTNAVFREGDLTKLTTAGQWIAIDGSWDGNTFTARYVDLENELESESGDRESANGSDSRDGVNGETTDETYAESGYDLR